MREFDIVLGNDFPAKRAVKIAKWLSEQSRPVRQFLFVSLTAVVTLLDMLPGGIDTDPLYALPVVIACWMFRPTRSVVSVIVVVTIIMVKYLVVDINRDPLVLLGDVLVHSLALVFLGVVAISLRELFDYAQRLAVRDHMTGLLNKAAFNDRVDAKISLASDRGKPLLLLLLDLDGFKAVNDNFGHAAGDSFLQSFSRDALDLLRREDCFGRIGGDEFAVVLEADDVTQAESLAADIHRRFTRVLASTGYQVTCSIGAVIAAPDHRHDRLRLLRIADAQLYNVKRNGKNGLKLLVLENGLRSAGPMILPGIRDTASG